MRRICLSVAALSLSLSLLAPQAHAGPGLKERVAQDRVKFVDGKMVIDEFELCKSTVPGSSKASFQLRHRAEVPVSAGVSRDYLVSFQATMKVLVRLTLAGSVAKGSSVAAHEALDCDSIGAPIGKVDLETNLYVTADGYQIAMLDGSTGKTTRSSKRWEDE